MNVSVRQPGPGLTVLAISLALLAPAARADEAAAPTPPEPASFAQALKGGKAAVDLRFRVEDVSQDGFAKDAHAFTLRTTVGYATAPWKGLSFEIEAENVAELGNDLYDNRGAGSHANGVTDRPVVADPAITELNEVFVRLKRGGNELTLGRREVLLGDLRYVGNVGWRQNHQSFDAFTFTNTSLARATFEYGYLDEVHRIFGDSQPMSSHFLDVGIEAGGAGRLRLYGLLLDYDRPQDSGRSTSTFGAELTGGRKVGGGETRVLWELELADQSDAGDNPQRISAGYLHGVLGAALPKVTLKAGLEVLEGSPGSGSFNTPLATLHKWNGWADKFLSTPANGLEDLYLSLGGQAGKVGWLAVYHDFSAESGGAGYGTELDLQLTFKTKWAQVFGLKAALYDADAFATDTDKLMFWTTYGF